MAFRFVHEGITARVQVKSLLPWVVGRDGITIGRTIFLSGGQASVSGYLLAHEWRHVKQWHDLGRLRFLWRYLRDLVGVGYKAHPLELEAHEFGEYHAALFERWAITIRGGR